MAGEEAVLAQSQTAESSNAAAVAEEARQKALAAQIEAGTLSAIEKFFNRGVQERKFIDIGRIPFICDDIAGIHATMTKWSEDRVTKIDFALLKQQSDLTNKIVIGACALILAAVLVALVGLVIIK